MRRARATGSTATIVASFLACALVSWTSTASAAPAQVSVRIEGRTQTLFEGPIATEGHAVRSFKGAGGNEAEDIAEHACDGTNNSRHVAPGPTPTAAAVDAMELIGETQAMAGQWYPGFDDYLVKQWGSEGQNSESEGRSWGILVNNVYSSVGGCQYEIGAGGEALWIYNAFASRPVLALFAADAHYSSGPKPITATAALGEPFEVEALAYEDDVEGAPPSEPQRSGAAPFEGAVIAPVATGANGSETIQLDSPEAVTTDSQGRARLTFTTPGWHRVKAGGPVNPVTHEEEVVRSNRLDVCVPSPGETGCGQPPAEDQIRTPPRYVSPPARPHEAEMPQTGAGQTNGGAGGAVTSSSGSLASFTSRTPETIAIASISTKLLVVYLTRPGALVVRLARRAGRGKRARWVAFKTITARSTSTGRVAIKLPRLKPGSYRVTVSAASATRLARTFTVHKGR